MSKYRIFMKCKIQGCENHTSHESKVCMTCWPEYVKAKEPWSDVSDIEKRLAAVSSELSKLQAAYAVLTKSLKTIEGVGLNTLEDVSNRFGLSSKDDLVELLFEDIVTARQAIAEAKKILNEQMEG